MHRNIIFLGLTVLSSYFVAAHNVTVDPSAFPDAALYPDGGTSPTPRAMARRGYESGKPSGYPPAYPSGCETCEKPKRYEGCLYVECNGCDDREDCCECLGLTKNSSSVCSLRID